ncbi:MAG: hypothetical protein ACRD2W_15135 [Acidimicrobiales bacterium]
MAADRRVVRVSSAFFDQLDEQLLAARGPGGEPSAADFVVMELPSIVERFALEFDRLPETIDGVASARMVIAPGLLVRAFAVHGVLIADDVVELIGIVIEH